jgi:uncharacterized membrane protein
VDTTRLEAFSDGVFAVAITLLVLEFKVPHDGHLAAGLIALWPSYLAYVISFVVIGAIWINHHVMFEWIIKADQKLLLLNTLLLLFIAFLPFVTAVLAEAFHERVDQDIAAAFYGATLTTIGLCVTFTWRHCSRNPQLLSDTITPRQITAIGKQYALGPLGYGVATASAFVSPWISISIFIALNVFFLWPRRTQEPHVADSTGNQ